MEEHIQEAKDKGESSGSELLTKLAPGNTGKLKGNKRGEQGKNMGNAINVVKLPSDTTIYVQALNRLLGNEALMGDLNVAQTGILGAKTNVLDKANVNRNSEVHNQGQPELMTKISNFVDQMRLDVEESEQQEMDMQQDRPHPHSSINAPRLEEAQKRMEQTLVQTEKFKTAIEKPPGTPFNPFPYEGLEQPMLPIFNYPGQQQVVHLQKLAQPKMGSQSQINTRQVIGSGVTDVDFFHLTCHIDPALVKKIEKGEFVDLNKLLPKDNMFHGRAIATNKT